MKCRLIRRRTITISFDEALDNINKLHPQVPIEYDISNHSNINVFDLSIIVPVYDSIKVINECIDSIVNQKTDFRYEIILVDDGSTDGTGEVIDTYEDLSNVTIVHQNNQGIASARNAGLEKAQGSYIMFVDCDDTIHDDMVDLLLKEAKDNDYDIVMCGHNLVKEKNGKTTCVIPNIYPNANLLGLNKNDYILNFAGLPWGKIYKRSLWNQTRFIKGYWYEDTIIQLLIYLQCNKFNYLEKVEYEYKWYESNFSHVQEKSTSYKVIDYYWLVVECARQFNKYPGINESLKYTALLTHLSHYFYSKVKFLDDKTIDSLFVLACQLLEENKPIQKYRLPYVLKITERAMLSKNIELWKISSQYQ